MPIYIGKVISNYIISTYSTLDLDLFYIYIDKYFIATQERVCGL